MVDVSTNVETVVVPSHVSVRKALDSMQMEEPAAIQVRMYSLSIQCRSRRYTQVGVFVVTSDKGLCAVIIAKGRLLTARGVLIVQSGNHIFPH